MSIKSFIKNPYKIFFKLRGFRIINKIPDEIYVKIMYRAYMGRKLNLKNPKSLNEKLQWLKLYNHKPEYTKMVDKYEAKDYVSKIIGNEYIIPTIGCYQSFEEIDFDTLPDSFVMKCTHDSGGLVICRNKHSLNKKEAQIKIKKSLKNNFYYYGREWIYKGVGPRIIVEKYIEEDEKDGLTDYKFYCFNGKAKFLYISRGLENHSTACMSFYDLDLNKLPFYRSDYTQIDQKVSKPENFDKMIAIAEKLAMEIPFLRVDLYNVKGRILFSELTFIPNSGYMPFEPEEWDLKLGEYLELPTKKII